MADPRIYSEKRREPRAQIGVVVRIETDEGSHHYYSKNISRGGIFLLAENPLEVETKVKMELFLPLIKTPVEVEGEVAWIQRQEPSGFAIRFTRISESSRGMIQWVVERYLGNQNE
jgi:uncharacterized protein (TIGR02266 family)